MAAVIVPVPGPGEPVTADSAPEAALTPTIGLEGAAKLLNCHPETVRQLAKSGELPGTKVGRSWVFFTDDLVVWLQARIQAASVHRSDPTLSDGPSLAESIRKHREQRIASKRKLQS